jgi:hypothetical protein
VCDKVRGILVGHRCHRVRLVYDVRLFVLKRKRVVYKLVCSETTLEVVDHTKILIVKNGGSPECESSELNGTNTNSNTYFGTKALGSIHMPEHSTKRYTGIL